MQLNNLSCFFILIVLSLLIRWGVIHFLDIDYLMYKEILGKFTVEQTENLYETMQSRLLWGYLLFPFIIFLKISFITGVVYTGGFFLGKDYKYGKLWPQVVKAEFIFILPTLITVFWFYRYPLELNLKILNSYYPLSIANFFNHNQLDTWIMIGLKNINLFEILYVLLLSFFIHKQTDSDGRLIDNLKIVSISYGLLLAFWILLVMFLFLNIS